MHTKSIYVFQTMLIKIPIILLNIIDQLVFKIEMDCVFCETENEIT